MQKFYLFIFLLGASIFSANAQAGWRNLNNAGAQPYNGQMPNVTLCIDDSDHVYVTYTDTPYSAKLLGIAEWDGYNWNKLGLVKNVFEFGICSAVDAAGNAYLGDGMLAYKYTSAGPVIPLGKIPDPQSTISPSKPQAMCTDKQGNMYMSFQDGLKKKVAKWNGTNWSRLPDIPFTANDAQTFGYGGISSMCFDTSGNLFVSGLQDSSHNSTVERWDGTKWTHYENNDTFITYTKGYVCTDGQGQIYANGSFRINNNKYHIIKWNGSGWSPYAPQLSLYGSNSNITFNSLFADKTGNLYMTGSFKDTFGSYYVAKYNGTNWSEVGTGTEALDAKDQIIDGVSDKKGNIYVGGYFKDTVNHYYVAEYSMPLITGENAIVKTPLATLRNFPNPFNNATQITIEGIDAPYTFELYDITGRQKLTIPALETNRFVLQRANLPAGLYLQRIVTSNGVAGYGKLVIE